MATTDVTLPVDYNSMDTDNLNCHSLSVLTESDTDSETQRCLQRLLALG